MKDFHHLIRIWVYDLGSLQGRSLRWWLGHKPYPVTSGAAACAAWDGKEALYGQEMFSSCNIQLESAILPRFIHGNRSSPPRSILWPIRTHPRNTSLPTAQEKEKGTKGREEKLMIYECMMKLGG